MSIQPMEVVVRFYPRHLYRNTDIKRAGFPSQLASLAVLKPRLALETTFAASASQAEGRGFETRLPLQYPHRGLYLAMPSQSDGDPDHLPFARPFDSRTCTSGMCVDRTRPVSRSIPPNVDFILTGVRGTLWTPVTLWISTES